MLKKTPKCALPSATEAFKHAGTTEMKLFLEYHLNCDLTAFFWCTSLGLLKFCEVVDVTISQFCREAFSLGLQV